jgi:hypothetical protein
MKILVLFMILASTIYADDSISSQAIQQPEQGRDNPENSETNTRQQPSYKRLILKDGSYQSIRKYEINGKFVRYFSSERHEWEEVPYSLVDWDATEKYENETASERKASMAHAAEDDAKVRAEEEDRTPLVSPGIRLPPTGGVFLLDSFKGQPELNQLLQNGADVNKNTAGNILRGVINPIAGSRRTIELAGLHARVQAHVDDPTIYVSLDSVGDPAANYTPENAKDHFRIVRCEVNKGKRTVWVANVAVYGKVNRQATYVETKVEPISRNWVKVSPVIPLAPGEYALVELLGKQEINTFVWDFGVNASAPENANVLKEDPAKANEPPVLQKRENPAKP